MAPYLLSHEVDSLGEQVAATYVQSCFPVENQQSFLPHGSEDRLVTRRSVVQALYGNKGTPAEDTDLVNWILQSAKKIFIISFISFIREKWLEIAMTIFKENGFVDGKLPIVIPKNAPGHPCFPSNIWPTLNRNAFVANQWQLLVPVFPKSFAKLELHQDAIFPFTFVDEEQKAGTFGDVYQVTVHEAHQKEPMRKVGYTPGVSVLFILLNCVPLHADLLQENGDPANAAIKELKLLGQKDDPIYKEWEAESRALEDTSGLGHPHVVQVRAIISKARRHYFMFQWADGGSLREFYEKQPAPKLDANLVRDTVQQLVGLASALRALHNYKDEGSYRHGDLKPENILIFKDTTTSGTWKIADMGLAKRHVAATEVRGPTSTRYGTPSYEPPEVVTMPSVARSRLYDIWSMGCITLELIIWLLYGDNALVAFNNSMKTSSKHANPYWVFNDGDQVAKIHPNVAACISYIKEEPECQGSTAIGDLLELVETKQHEKKIHHNVLTDKGTGATISFQDGNSGICYSASQALLNEVWDFPVDNVFATNMELWAGEFLHTDKVSELEKQSPSCDFCRLRWDLCKRLARGAKPVVHFDRLESTIRLNEDYPPVLTIHRDPGSSTKPWPPSPLQIGLPKLPQVGSNSHYEILRHWLDDCDHDHPQCKPTSEVPCLPTRLVYVGTRASPALRLYETKPGDNMKYLALSHPWGSPPHYCTITTNIEKHKKGIIYDNLPTTFQHAVAATRGLGVQYLWIDSLCIIQGPDGDFQNEAKRMEDVFSQADCVLAASSAAGQWDGFLTPREARNYLKIQQNDRPPVYLCDYIDDFNKHVRGSYLNQRGWVFQERALARRTIYFTSKQTYWECGGGVRCETMTKMHNTLESFLGDPNFPKVAMESSHGGKIRLYQDLYMQYSRLAFTHAQDRPVAIAGLEQRLITSFGVQGGFGVFENSKAPGELRRSLLWHRAADVNSLEPINFRGHRGLAAGSTGPPTWSWMAYEGGIEYLDLPFGQVEWEKDDILSMGTWSGKDGTAVTVGLSVNARNINTEPLTGVSGEKIVFDVPNKTNRPFKCVVLGRTMEPEKHVANRTHFVLLVTRASPAARGEQVYHRVGVGAVPGSCIELDGPAARGKIV
ncbi:hypothetical protein VPNG_04583 [Cytospora leucostoma]|uniref:Protein kinase domain-containing protein n=1 Tax=Cytospora leucostoma TaxID=1230097 RepID=A0A423XCI2_9PEZI|nr:hypothetical protein VPNG_04583 [Cytospora leucostoma]